MRPKSLVGGTVLLGLILHCGGSDGAEVLTPNDDSGVGDSGLSADTHQPNQLVDSGPDGTIVSSGGTTADAGPGGSTSSITCGSTSCAIPSQSCCVDRVGGGAAAYTCVSGTGCPAPTGGGDPQTVLQCSGAANCAGGTVCCVHVVGGVTSSKCEVSCTGADTAQLCDPALGAQSGCPNDAGAACSSANIGDWGLPRTFGTCGGKGN